MIVDLNLKGKQVLLVGGGREAARKVESLVSQECEIIVVAPEAAKSIVERAGRGQISWVRMRVQDGGFLKQYPRLHLVLAVTGDRELNRNLVAAAREMRCFGYCADDPEFSDFSHPAVINLYDRIQVAVSTGGRSPLMAKKLREETEAVLLKLVKKEDIYQIDLQEKLRPHAKNILPTPERRKAFLESINHDTEILELLSRDRFDEACDLARARLEREARNEKSR